MTALQEIFFIYFNMMPDFLLSPPIIEFISIAMGIYVAGIFITIFNGGRK